MKQEANFQVINNPLCVFSLSPAFAVQEYISISHPTSRRAATPYWRRGDFSLPRIRPRFKPIRKQNSHTLTKYLTDRIKNKQKENLTLQQVLDILKGVWNSPDAIFKSSLNMNNNKKKNSTSSDLHSPILFRRRLSAPETIMRKHVLAQQRSDSQDSDCNQGFDVQSCQWRIDKEIGSDLNLSKKRDHNLMRKSTLLRRLWGSSKPLSEKSSKFPSTYSEWQYGKVHQGRSTHSLCSNHSSPEHVKNRSRNSINDELRTSPTRYNKKVASNEMSLANNNDQVCSFETISSSFSTARTTTSNDVESEQYSARSTSTSSNTCTTTFSENCDLTYTNTNSNFSTTESSSTRTYSSEIFLEENGNSRENENVNLFKDREGNDIKISYNNESDKVNDSATQTLDTANVNVISNVQLSQSTLNLIFNQVLQDVQKSPATNININTAKVPLEPNLLNSTTQSKIIQVQQVPSFYLKEQNQVKQTKERQLLKYMVSNVGIGTYNKPLEGSQVVPRFSALPQSTSMEVNVSSGESDKESDNVSLMDSLEDQNSPRIDFNKSNKYDEKPVRGELSPLLPDNSDDKSTKTEKTAAFFIPIESNVQTECKSVAEHLPEKVKERLFKRQLKREQKMKQSQETTSSKSDSNYVSASENGDLKGLVSTSTLPDINLNKTKRKNKPTLPNIKIMRKIRTESKEVKKSSKATKRKVEEKNQELGSSKKDSWISKTRHKILEPLNAVCSKNYVYDVMPKRIFHKTELNNFDKRIEILEIVECVSSNSETNSQRCLKTKKSKIPVFVNSKLPNITKNEKYEKPIYLDFDQVHDDDPKIDQLIANILIDALNKSEPEKEQKTKNFQINEIRPTHSSRHHPNKYQQIFESIPEERSISLNSSSEGSSNSKDDEKKIKKEDYKGKAAIGVTNEDTSTIPKGWITFYTLRKSQGSPDSTSDEGKKNNTDTSSSKCNRNPIQDIDKKIEETEIKKNKGHKSKKTHSANNIISSKDKNLSQDSFDTWTSSDQEKYKRSLPPPNLHRNQPRKYRSDSSTNKTAPNGWTVTVSGSTSGHHAPELEMRLRFPPNNTQNNPASQSDSGLGEENLSGKKENLPYLMPTKENNRRNRVQTTDNIQQLPKILRNKSTNKLRQYENVYPIHDYIEPRQTKTSSRRLLLNRPRTFIQSHDYINDDSIESNFKELMKKFPEILKVTGNSIGSEKRAPVSTTSARDFSR